LVEQLIRNE